MTISDAYRQEQMLLHSNPNYGVASLKFAPVVKHLMEKSGAKSLSDYGAGKRNLLRGLRELGFTPESYSAYDPAFPEYGEPKPADLVCCIDVLEHIEPDFLDDVLADLAKITLGIGFYTIHTGPAAKVLSDGRNAHLIQEPASWWLPKLCTFVEVRTMQEVPGGFYVGVSPLQK